jgi:hypothetical protein
MSTTIVRQIKLRRWFPPEDLFAAYVARMTILREDFATEMMGIYEEQIAPLDGNTEGYRMVYFWRNMLRAVVRQIVVHHTKRISFSLGRFFGLGSHADSSIRENARRERGLSWPGFKKEFGSQKNSS